MNLSKSPEIKLPDFIITSLFILFLLLVAGPLTAFSEVGKNINLTIRSASEYDYPPFCILDEEGRATGFSVELLRAAVRAMAADVTFRTGPWAEVKELLKQGEIDALPLVGRTPEREAFFDFSFPYLTLHGTIVVRKDTTDIHDFSDLDGRKVAVMKGDNAEEFVRREEREFEIHTTPTFADALQQLSDGVFDAVVVQRLVAHRLIRERGLKNLQVINRPIHGFRQDFCFAVPEGRKDTLALLNEGLALVMADGTFRALNTKWFATQEIPSIRPLVIGGDHNYPPFEYLDDKGRPTGFNVELIRAVARQTGLNIEIHLGPWSEIREALLNGEIDAIQGMFYSPERGSKFNFSSPYTVNHCIAVARKDSGPPPTKLDDLKGKRIVVQNGDIMHDFLVKNGFKDLISVVDSQEAALLELARGNFDYALVSRLTALYWIKKKGWENLALGQKPLFSPEYCYAVPHNSRALLAQFNEGLKILEDSGEYRRIRDKWLGIYEDSPSDFATILRHAAMVAGPLILLLFLVFLWSWSLRKQVAKRTAELKKSEAYLRTLLRTLPDLAWLKDPQGTYLFCNTRFESFFGAKMEDIVGKTDYDFVGKELADFFRKHDKKAMDKKEPTINEEEITFAEDGHREILETIKTPIFFKDGELAGVLGLGRNITERKLAEQVIQDSEAKYKILFETVSDANFLIDKNTGHILEVNSAASKIYGFSREEFLRMKNTDVSAEPEKTHKATHEKLTSIPLRYHKKKDGTVFPVEIAASHLAWKGQEVHIASIRDVSFRIETEKERQKLQDQLIQAQKIESVGRLAGGVAHDFNNMLFLIMGYAESAMEEVPSDSSLRSDLEEILYAAQRSADITRQLLAFARQQPVSPAVVDLNEHVEQSLKMLRRLIGEDIELAWNPRQKLWPIKIDASQIDQILANLCINSRDAISGVGGLGIKTENVVLDEFHCVDHPGMSPGEFVRLELRDNGCGMEKATLEKIFEPFYTTKPVGQGTGLGLATVYGIVKQNNGFIYASSELGEGTTFEIYFPRHAEESVETNKKKKSADTISGLGETIMLVEDDTSILKFISQKLESSGYKLLPASRPLDALALAENHEGDIDLLITDVVMPEMNGKDLAEHLLAQHPDLKCLYMSGYPANIIAQQGILEKGIHFLQKPFTVQKLAIKIRAILDNQSGEKS
ncbi:MAG: transporter substrate-binding domain-containing protein [Deltaproteobacteria bacterium]|nr:transporter substrate-binding domain-containing protein [Deltaproteobacteria bacterium]